MTKENLFLSHTWGVDTLNRNIHERVRMLKNALVKLGWKVWFDEDRLILGCNLDSEMANGIKKSDDGVIDNNENS
jgi:hypothetical protein